MSATADWVDDDEPECPRCGGDMTLREARTGRNAGKEFWGCDDFPDCRGTLDADDWENRHALTALRESFVPVSFTNPRTEPYIWATWLSGMIAGDVKCQWRSWFRAHYQLVDQEDEGDLLEWQMNHTRLLSELVQELEREGTRVEAERDFQLRVPGIRATVAGKIDLVTTHRGRYTVYECKTGRPKAADKAQVMLYMHALEVENGAGTARGVLVYRDRRVEVPEVSDTFRSSLLYFARLCAGDAPALKVSGWDCKYCPITRADCPEKRSF